MVKYNEISTFAQLQAAKIEHVHISDIRIVKVSPLGYWWLFLYNGNQAWGVIFQVRGKKFPMPNSGYISTVEFINGKFSFNLTHG